MLSETIMIARVLLIASLLFAAARVVRSVDHRRIGRMAETNRFIPPGVGGGGGSGEEDGHRAC